MNSGFFTHRECEYFPCHEGIPPEEFNCLFCWCPLYALGKSCGGSCVYLEDGTKDCSGCLIPHGRNAQAVMCSRFAELAELAKKP